MKVPDLTRLNDVRSVEVSYHHILNRRIEEQHTKSDAVSYSETRRRRAICYVFTFVFLLLTLLLIWGRSATSVQTSTTIVRTVGSEGEEKSQTGDYS